MKTYNQFINESAYKDQFLYLYNLAPESLQKEIDQTEEVLQSVEWHSEGVVYIHIRLVTNRLENCYHDINLTLAGLFHDLGKTYVTKPNGRGGWSAHGHEDESVKIVEKYKDWIIDMGGDVDIVKYVVANHMRYKVIDDMRMQEQIKFINEEYFPYVQKFATADFGGTDLNCKEINNQEEIKEKLKEFKKREEDNKIINSKFNGRMVMDKYPELKGKSLGDALTKFKSSFDDFNEYVFNNPSDKIMKKFDDFISSKLVSNKFATNESIRDLMKPKSKEEINKSLEDLSPKEKLDKDEEWGIYTEEEVNDLLYKLNTDDKLEYGVYRQNIDVIKLALKDNASNSIKSRSLCTAIYNNFIDIVKLLLDNGTSPNAMMGSPLLIAVQSGNDYLVKLLLDYGAKLKILGDDLLSKLINNDKISNDKKYKIMKLLLDAGGNLDINYSNPNFKITQEMRDLLKKYNNKI